MVALGYREVQRVPQDYPATVGGTKVEAPEGMPASSQCESKLSAVCELFRLQPSQAFEKSNPPAQTHHQPLP